MRQISYKQDGPIIVLKNAYGLKLGTHKFDDARVVMSDDMLGRLERENPDVEFVKVESIARSQRAATAKPKSKVAHRKSPRR